MPPVRPVTTLQSPTLLPLVLLVLFSVLGAGWTAFLVGGAQGPRTAGTPEALLVPREPVKGPASVSKARKPAAPGPRGVVRPAIGVTSTGIPSEALAAYQRAAAVLDVADPACHLPWTLLAAIGRVESDHGRYGGGALDAGGRAVPAIYGVPLDGSRSTARIADTDGGTIDTDTTFDRAVGPMQFIPTTWSMVGVDGDGDGRRDPRTLTTQPWLRGSTSAPVMSR
ncbi:lytic murein transglycosylase [Nocardioides houyundeii]|uniref:lytic murein transglycosylase n=1 Tax=Nocardioides houyundeii TaxID=2045452 RepID=UPI000C75E366|nr:lytic murein transglycosylase [Nocardioides houyundeii]